MVVAGGESDSDPEVSIDGEEICEDEEEEEEEEEESGSEDEEEDDSDGVVKVFLYLVETLDRCWGWRW